MSTELINKGKELMEKAQFTAAEQKFREALKADLRSIEAMLWLTRLALMKGDRQAAHRLVDEALKVKPDHAEAIALRGVIAMTGEKFDEAVANLEMAKTINPDLEMIYYNLARTYRKLGKLDLAENAARRAIELNPKNFQAHGELSNILYRNGRRGDAIRHMAEAIRINPLFLKGYVVLGEAFKLAGKGDTAIRIYRRGLKHNPLAHVLRQELCGLYALKGDFKRAYREAAELAVRRNHFGDYLRLGTYALILGGFEKAEKAFKKSIELNPQGWQGHYNLGELYSAAKLVKEARQEYQAAIDRDGKSAKPQNGMGLLALMQENNPKEAKNHFRRAIDLAPKSAVPVLNMALACSASKEYTEAAKFAEEAKKLAAPGSPVFQQAEKLSEVIRRERGN